jgi:hypothetical protein
MTWQPTTILRFNKALPTSACTAIVETDAGTGYLKAMGGSVDPHTLACEWMGTQLAAWLGLPTLEFALLDVTIEDEIPFVNEKGERIGQANPGPAFITRKEFGEPWGGDVRQLRQLANASDISRIVVFDTWTLNCDRHGPREGRPLEKPRINLRNVFLSEDAPPGQLLLKAIDHNCCFTCGKSLTVARLRDVARMKDDRIFGRFPEFVQFLSRSVVREAATRLAGIDKKVVASMMRGIPHQWEVRKEVQEAWVDLIVGRAKFVASTVETKLWPQKDLDLGCEDSEVKP